jgi:hypothetical protein
MDKFVEDMLAQWGFKVENPDLAKLLAINCLIVERLDELLAYVRPIRTYLKKIEKREEFEA